jgi:hypothetical protein
MTRRKIEIAAFCVALLLGAMAVHAWLASRDEQQRLASTLAAQKQLLDAADARERTRQSALDDTLAQIENLKRETQTPAQILLDLPKYLSLPQPITMTPAAGQGTRKSAKGAAPLESAAVEESKDGVGRPNSSPTKSDGREAPSDLPSSADGRPRSPTLLPQNVAPFAGPQRTPASPVVSSQTCDQAGNCAAQIPSADLKPLYDYVQDCRACQAQLAAAKQNASDDVTKIAALARERDAAVTASKGGTFWRRVRRNAEWFAVGAALGAATGYKASKR